MSVSARPLFVFVLPMEHKSLPYSTNHTNYIDILTAFLHNFHSLVFCIFIMPLCVHIINLRYSVFNTDFAYLVSFFADFVSPKRLKSVKIRQIPLTFKLSDVKIRL